MASTRPTRRPPCDSSVAQEDNKYELVCLEDVPPEPIDWLWQDRIATGKLTIFAGDPGLGKSTLTLDIAARVSTGGAWPDSPEFTTQSGSVILLSAEDGLADTIRPRLDAAGADPSRVFFMKMNRTRTGARSHFNLRRDVAQLEQAIRDRGDVRLVVIDPLAAYMGGIDDHKNADVRGLLAPLAEMAERLKVAVVLVAHLNKNVGGKFAYRLSGSMAYVAAARTVWLVDQDPNRPERRLMLQIKNNIAAAYSGLAFGIVKGALRWEPEPVELTADQSFAAEGSDPGREDEPDEVVDFLNEFLSDGPKPSTEVYEQGSQAGYGEKVLQRAKKKAGIKAVRNNFGKGGNWDWMLPRKPPKVSSDEKPGTYGTYEGQDADQGKESYIA